MAGDADWAERSTPAINDRSFVQRVIDLLAADGLAVWIFGGWAQELWRDIPSRNHNDIDLLYPAEKFDALDTFIARHGLAEIRAKRFSHKRAIEYEAVMVEFFLLIPNGHAYETNFFDGRALFRWPGDTLSYTLPLVNGNVNVASRSALGAYRAGHSRIHSAAGSR